MTTIQQSFAYVNARFFSLLDQIQAGTLTSVDILNTAGSAVIAKIVDKASFDAAIALGGVATEVVVPQLPYGVTPQMVGYNGLFKLVKQLRDDNAIVESSTKANLAYVRTVAATLTTYNDGGGNGLTLTAKTAGTSGNLLTFTVVDGVAEGVVVTDNDTVLTLNTGVSTLTSIAATLGDPGVPFTVSIDGLGATVAWADTIETFTGGDEGQILFTAVASGPLGNDLTVTLTDPTVLTAATTAAIVGNDVEVTLKHDGVNVTATLAEVASVVTVDSGTLRMTALASGTTSLAVENGGMAQTNLAGGATGSGSHYIAYEVTRAFLPSRQAGVGSSSTVRAVMIPKALADQIGL